MKRLLMYLAGFVLSACMIAVLLFVNVFHEHIESSLFTILLIVSVILLPILFVISYFKKIKRIRYLEERLRKHDIPFAPEE